MSHIPEAVIIEDEPEALNLLQSLLTENGLARVTGSATDPFQAVGLISSLNPDIVFLDIKMPGKSGFDILDELNSKNIDHPFIVFTTAYDEYAIEAFKVNSIDYLLKPIKTEDMKRALEKFKKLSRQDVLKYLAQLTEFSPLPKYKDKILVPHMDKLQPVDLKDVSFFYTTEKNTRICLKNGKSLPYSKTLDQIEVTLNPADFFRANKQFIVARNSVKNLTIWFDSRLLLTLDVEPPERIYVSKNKAAEFKAWIVRDI